MPIATAGKICVDQIGRSCTGTEKIWPEEMAGPIAPRSRQGQNSGSRYHVAASNLPATLATQILATIPVAQLWQWWQFEPNWIERVNPRLLTLMHFQWQEVPLAITLRHYFFLAALLEPGNAWLLAAADQPTAFHSSHNSIVALALTVAISQSDAASVAQLLRHTALTSELRPDWCLQLAQSLLPNVTGKAMIERVTETPLEHLTGTPSEHVPITRPADRTNPVRSRYGKARGLSVVTSPAVQVWQQLTPLLQLEPTLDLTNWVPNKLPLALDSPALFWLDNPDIEQFYRGTLDQRSPLVNNMTMDWLAGYLLAHVITVAQDADRPSMTQEIDFELLLRPAPEMILIILAQFDLPLPFAYLGQTWVQQQPWQNHAAFQLAMRLSRSQNLELCLTAVCPQLLRSWCDCFGQESFRLIMMQAQGQPLHQRPITSPRWLERLLMLRKLLVRDSSSPEWLEQLQSELQGHLDHLGASGTYYLALRHSADSVAQLLQLAVTL